MYKFQKYDVYLQEDLFIQWIEALALEGLFLDDLYENSILLKFKKAQPRKVKYALYFDVTMSVIEDFVDQAKENGWTLVGSESNKKTVFLFISEDENSIALEMDKEESHQRISYGLKKERFTLFLWAILVVMTFRNFEKYTNSMAIIQATVYVFLLISLLVSHLRRSAYLDPSGFFKGLAIHSIKIYMILWSIVGLLIGFETYMYLNAKQVEKAVHSDFVEAVQMTDQNLSLERSTQSLFSLNPTATYLVQYQNKNELSTMIYQTRHFTFVEVDQAFLLEYLSQSHPAILQTFQTFELIASNEEEILYRNPYSETENLSIKKVGSLIYTLHSINLTLEEHLKILREMGKSND